MLLVIMCAKLGDFFRVTSAKLNVILVFVLFMDCSYCNNAGFAATTAAACRKAIQRFIIAQDCLFEKGDDGNTCRRSARNINAENVV